MPSRRLPRTHTARSKVLRKASLKGHATAAADRAVPPALWAKLDLLPATTPAHLYLAALTAVDTAQSAAHAATLEVNQLLKKALRLISHFFQVGDFAITRGDWPAAARDFYGRDPFVDTLPDLQSVDDALFWGDKIATGELARTAAGGAPMAMPGAAQVGQALYDLNLALGTQTSAADALRLLEQTPDNLLPGPTGIEKLILDLYNDVENHYRDYPAGTRRDFARAWGVQYDDDPEEEEEPGSSSSSSSSSSS